MKKVFYKTGLLIAMMFCFFNVHAIEKIVVMALFQDKVMLRIDGENRLLSKGKVSPEGIRVISVNSNEAVLEFNGQKKSYPLGSHIGSSYKKKEQAEIQIMADNAGMYRTAGSINGMSVYFLVDTGATLIAMNSQHAKKLGIDYRVTGTESFAATASDVVKVHNVKLGTVKVGEITINNVDAIVMEGVQPSSILLGMSFLGRVEMTNDQGLLKLKKKF
ncbi:MAG: TIGR02281 family clan AA aspartic protease [Gammaproteobacteria bacterium]|nr:TIGR02281 family clan AA aspartic protease [Gammaproteobacteria bacterium]